jgi:N-acyl-D-aspartate/D-glutamate deacylase
VVISTELLRKQAAAMRKLADEALERGALSLSAHWEKRADFLDDRIWQLEHDTEPDATG